MPQGNILIVDDEANVRKLTELVLTKVGYTIHLASSGAEAVAMAGSSVPDLIVMDVMLQDMDGAEDAWF